MIKLGDHVTDVITGFNGTAFSRISYLTGPDRIGVIPRCEDRAKLPEAEYFDEERLMAVRVGDLQVLKEQG